jgi:hypothetical protein
MRREASRIKDWTPGRVEQALIGTRRKFMGVYSGRLVEWDAPGGE